MLLGEKTRLEEELAEIVNGNHDPSGGVKESLFGTHMGDGGTETFERERDRTLEQNVRDLLGRVNFALGRLEKGTYGVCECCGGEITAERLKALPYADMCIECKRKDEAW